MLLFFIFFLFSLLPIPLLNVLNQPCLIGCINFAQLAILEQGLADNEKFLEKVKDI